MSDAPIAGAPGTTADWWLGIDIGGTRTKFGVVSAAGQVSDSRVLTTDQAPFGHIWELLLAYAEDVTERHHRDGLRGIGVAAPGLVDPLFGVRNLPGKVAGIEGFPLRVRLEETFGVMARCVNDGAAATLAEWRFGAATGRHDVVGLTIGTGLGCGVVMGDRLLVSGHHGAASSFGHVTIDNRGRTCLCGNIGCAETLVSANALVGQARGYVARKVPSVLTERFESTPEDLGFADIVAASAEQDRIAQEIMHMFQRDLGATIVTAIHAYDPEVVVLAGGPLAAAEHFLPQVQAYVDTYAFRYPRDRTIPILRAQRSDHAGVLGAVALVLQAAEAGATAQEMTS